MADRTPEHPTASDEPLFDSQPDDFELLWARHKKSIIIGAVALVVIVAGVFGWMTATSSARAAAAEALASASTSEEYEAIIRDHSGSVVAGNAALLLAERLRDENKIAEANEVLRKFIADQPDHPFASLAQVAIGENQALAGEYQDAINALQGAADAHPESFVAPVALLFRAELALATGNRSEAASSYARLEAEYPTSLAAESAVETVETLAALEDTQGE